MCVDGTPGNPWEWRVLLCFSGCHQQRHTVAGGPAAEGRAYVYIVVNILKEQIRYNLILKVLFVYRHHFSCDVTSLCVFCRS